MTKETSYCPECGGVMVRSGIVATNRAGDTKQQWKCPACGRRTLNPEERAAHHVAAAKKK